MGLLLYVPQSLAEGENQQYIHMLNDNIFLNLLSNVLYQRHIIGVIR